MDDSKRCLAAAIKEVLQAGHYVSFRSNVRLSPQATWYEVKNYTKPWAASRAFNDVDEAVSYYLMECRQSLEA